MSNQRDFARLRRLIIRLLDRTPFFGHVLALTSREMTEELGPFKAAMTISRNNLKLIINPSLFFADPEDNQMWVIVHEVLHFLFKHPWRSKMKDRKVKGDPLSWTSAQVEAFIENLAMDLAINSYMKHNFVNNVPGGVPMPEEFGFPESKTFEWYLHHLRQTAQCPQCGMPLFGGGKGRQGSKGSSGKGQQGSGGKCSCNQPKAGKALKKWVGQFFGHAWQIDCDDAQANALASRFYQHGCRLAGTSPAGALRDVHKVEAVADFRDEIMKLAQSSELSDEQLFHKRRISRRFHRPPGSKYETLGEIHVLQDTSGSMGPKDIGSCYSVMDKLRRMGYDIYVYEFDAAFHGPEYQYKGVPPAVKGGGGTMMMSTLKYIAETKPDVKEVIVFTDSFVGDIPKNIPFGFKNIIFCIPEWVDNRLPDWIKVVKYRSEGRGE